MNDYTSMLESAYAAFNARDIDAALVTMHPDVDWANGMEGGRVLGHAAIRDYWTRQWGMIDSHAYPVRFSNDDAGRVVIDVRLVVRDLGGAVMADQMAQHVYTIEDGLVRRMEIRDSESGS